MAQETPSCSCPSRNATSWGERWTVQCWRKSSLLGLWWSSSHILCRGICVEGLFDLQPDIFQRFPVLPAILTGARWGLLIPLQTSPVRRQEQGRFVINCGACLVLLELLTLNRYFSIEQRLARHFPARNVDVLLGTRTARCNKHQRTENQYTERFHHYSYQSNPLSHGSQDGTRTTGLS